MIPFERDFRRLKSYVSIEMVLAAKGLRDTLTHHGDRLLTLVPRVILILDGDSAGRDASTRICHALNEVTQEDQQERLIFAEENEEGGYVLKGYSD